MGGCFKLLCNKSQKRVPVAVYVLPLGPDCDCPYFRLAATSELILLYKANNLIYCGLCDQYSLTLCHTLFIIAALLTRRVMRRPRCLLIRFSAGLLWLPTSYRFIPSERNQVTPLARSLWAFATWSFEQHWPLSLTDLYLFRTRRHGAEIVLQLEI